MDDSKHIAEYLSKIFSCEIVLKDPSRFYQAAEMKDETNYDYGELTMRLEFCWDKDKIYKYQNPYTHIWYIYDSKNKSAFSYYDDPEDDDDDTYVTDLYGITDWVDSIKAKKISMLELATYYKIIGL